MSMKNVITILFTLLFFVSFSQKEQFDCTNVNSYNLLNAYSRLKIYGLELKVKGTDGTMKDLMEFTISFLGKENALTQVCINATYYFDTNGLESCYSQFVKSYGYIDKNTYKENADFLEMLSGIRTSLKKAGY